MLFPGAVEDTDFKFLEKEHWFLLFVPFTNNLFDTMGKFAAGRKAFDL
jgi:hypothetical protein